MTDKKLKVNSAAYTELVIKIATLDMKVSKVLELLNKPDAEYEIAPTMINLKGQAERFNNTPPQWPNESHTDYLKRIGQYNEAQSTTETFDEEFK